MASRALFVLAVDFMSDFLTAFGTGIGVGAAGSATASLPPVPSRWMVYVAILGGLVTSLRGLKRNLTNPVVPVPFIPAPAGQEK